MKNRIKSKDLKPGDVLLYHGTSFIGKAIRLFDGTDYNHASIWDGENVVEALGQGVVIQPLDASVAGAKFIGVKRLVKNGAELGTPGLPVAPVLEKGIKFFKDNPDRYAYEEILLLAVLALTRKIPLRFLRWILDHAASVIVDILAGGKQPVICSELVYRCFLLAGENYLPAIIGAARLADFLRANMGITAPSGVASDEECERMRIVSEYLEQYVRAEGKAGIEALEIKSPNPNFVTPGDLFKSPDLKFLGLLEMN